MPIIAGERAAFAERCHARAISMSHLHLMSFLDAQGPLAMSRVAELLGSGLPTATGLVSRMEERGLVVRTHDTEDRRVVTVSLTEAGMEELRELNSARRARMAAALARLSVPEQTRLLAGIRTLRSAFEQLHEEGATLA